MGRYILFTMQAVYMVWTLLNGAPNTCKCIQCGGYAYAVADIGLPEDNPVINIQ